MTHLLRTMASVPPASRVLHVGDARGATTSDLARLGFDLWACASGEVAAVRSEVAAVLGEEEAEKRVTKANSDALGYPDVWFDWAAVHADGDGLVETLHEIRRVLKPGAWVWVGAANLSPDDLAAAASGADLAVAETASRDEEVGGARGIYRRVGHGVQD